jgi:hypothetical protein
MRTLLGSGLAQQLRQHRIQHDVRAGEVDLLVLEHFIEVVGRGALGLVVAGAVHHEVDAAMCVDDLSRRGMHGLAVGGVHRQRFAACVALRELLQGGDVARRDDHRGPGCMQLLGGGAADAGGSADQPADLALPVGDARVQWHDSLRVS